MQLNIGFYTFHKDMTKSSAPCAEGTNSFNFLFFFIPFESWDTLIPIFLLLFLEQILNGTRNGQFHFSKLLT